MAIEISDLTGGALDEAGIFDELMRSVKSHIQEEHDAERITDQNYSTVYLNAMENAMRVALELTLKRELTNVQIEIAQKQSLKEDKEIELLEARIQLINKQIEQATAEIALVTQRTLTEVEQTELVGHNADNAVKQGEILDQQKLKVEQDVEVARQNAWNLEAQRLDTVNSLPVAGSIGKQKELYQAQIDGFSRDAEQKLSKMLLDAWSVSRTTNDAVEVPTEANNTNIDEVLAYAKVGIGMTP